MSTRAGSHDDFQDAVKTTFGSALGAMVGVLFAFLLLIGLLCGGCTTAAYLLFRDVDRAERERVHEMFRQKESQLDAEYAAQRGGESHE